MSGEAETGEARPPGSELRGGEIRRWWPFAAGAVAVALALSLILPAGRHQWALSLFRQPTHYTALGFKYAWLLPSISRTGKYVPVFFTVTNHEGKTVDYHYLMRERGPVGSWQPLPEKGSAKVANGATWTIDTRVVPRCSASPCRVEVLLPSHPEIISFLVSLSPRRRR